MSTTTLHNIKVSPLLTTMSYRAENIIIQDIDNDLQKLKRSERFVVCFSAIEKLGYVDVEHFARAPSAQNNMGTIKEICVKDEAGFARCIFPNENNKADITLFPKASAGKFPNNTLMTQLRRMGFDWDKAAKGQLPKRFFWSKEVAEDQASKQASKQAALPTSGQSVEVDSPRGKQHAKAPMAQAPKRLRLDLQPSSSAQAALDPAALELRQALEDELLSDFEQFLEDESLSEVLKPRRDEPPSELWPVLDDGPSTVPLLTTDPAFGDTAGLAWPDAPCETDSSWAQMYEQA